MTTAELLAFMREYPMAVQASVAAAEGSRPPCEDTRGIAVDLRGCPSARPICLSALLAASSTPSTGRCRREARHIPRIAAPREVKRLVERPGYASAAEGLLSFSDAQSMPNSRIGSVDDADGDVPPHATR